MHRWKLLHPGMWLRHAQHFVWTEQSFTQRPLYQAFRTVDFFFRLFSGDSVTLNGADSPLFSLLFSLFPCSTFSFRGCKCWSVSSSARYVAAVFLNSFRFFSWMLNITYLVSTRNLLIGFSDLVDLWVIKEALSVLMLCAPVFIFTFIYLFIYLFLNI